MGSGVPEREPVRVQWKRIRVNRSMKAKCRSCKTPGILVIHLRNRNGEHGVVVACEVCDGQWLPVSGAALPAPASEQP